MNHFDPLIDQLAEKIARRVVEMHQADIKRRDLVMLTPGEMAQRLRVSPKTLANLRSVKKGPAFTKIAGRVRYPVTLDTDNGSQS